MISKGQTLILYETIWRLACHKRVIGPLKANILSIKYKNSNNLSVNDILSKKLF